MILVIRGHIRNSFDSEHLYNVIKLIYQTIPDLKIYMHTWNIVASNVSCRAIQQNNTEVNEDMIYTYFRDLKHLIKHIIIDDDTKIKLNGNLEGTINNGPMPLIGWKNYWYGKHSIINYLYNCNDIDKNEILVNTRFDLMSNSNNFDINHIMSFILYYFNQYKSGISFTKNEFLFNNEFHNGIDNIYIGNLNTMYKLMCIFNYNLDEILSKNNDTIHQERLVFRINKMIF